MSAAVPEVHVVDRRVDPCRLLRNQWSPHHVRDPAKFKGIAIHQWATKVSTEGRLRIRYGSEAEALGRRGVKVTYGISAGVGEIEGVPVVSLAHPPERYTYASDSACSDYISIGVMGLFPYTEDQRVAGKHTEVTPALIAAVNEAIEQAIAQMQGDGPWALITHRQGINGRGDHEECPGEAVVAMALMSDAVKDGRLVPDPDLVLVPKWGKPWPEAWRRHLEQRALPRVDDVLKSLSGAAKVSSIGLDSDELTA